MKRQNGVVLSGKLADLRAAEVKAGDPSAGSGQCLAGVYTAATLITDHAAAVERYRLSRLVEGA